MNKKRLLLFFAAIMIFVLTMTSCSKDEDSIKELDLIDEENNINEVENIDENNSTEIEEEILIETLDGVPSPLSGLLGEEEKLNRRPVAVMFDNHPKARWQAGISQAEIVYEFLVEPPYTRYMGIFLLNDPEVIGPVRSARPYFVEILLEYDPLYVRVGGSEAAKEDVKKYQVADIDGLYSPAFWRDTKKGKSAPNNLYTSMEAIREEQKRLKYKEQVEFEGFPFNEENTDIEGESAEEILINYYSNNTTKYEYDTENKVYKRYKDGKLHIDENDEQPILVKNIIIQEADTKVIDSEGRLKIDVIGKGKGIYITNGKFKEITWKKDSLDDKTKFFDEDGNIIKLNPGITWIQVTKKNPDVEIK